MRIPLYGARWVFLILYALLVLVLWMTGLSVNDASSQAWLLGLVTLMLGSQAVFIFSTGTRDLLKPVRRKRTLFWPVAIAATMMALLTIAFCGAMAELTRFSSPNTEEVLFWCILIGSWIGWGVLFFVHTRTRERFEALRRMTTFLLAGSLAELLACIPAHIVVSRRPGCLVGIMTGASVAAGVYVMFWSFGPGILLLFLRPKRDEAARQEAAGHVAENTRQGPRFSLGGLMLFTLFLASSMAAVLVPEKAPSLLLALVFGLWFVVHWFRQIRRWEKWP